MNDDLFDFDDAVEQRDLLAVQHAARESNFVPTTEQVARALDTLDHDFFVGVMSLGRLTLNEKDELLLQLFRHDDDSQERMTNGSDIVRSLLLAGANAQAGNLLIHHAYKHSGGTVAKHLLDFGANPNQKDENGDTPLHLAIRFERVLFANLFEKYFLSNVNAINNRGMTPLHVALINGDPAVFKSGEKNRVVQWLLDCGAEPATEAAVNLFQIFKEPADRNNYRPRIRVSMHRFLQYFDLDLWQNDRGENVMHLLAGADMEIHCEKLAITLALLDIQTLIKADYCLLEATDHSGQTPLHCAIRTNKPSKILNYLAKKCPMAIAMQDVQGQTPLHCAMKTYQPSRTLVLLAMKCPAAITMTDKDGKTPLHIAFGDLTADASASHRSFHHQIYSMLRSLHCVLGDVVVGLCTSLMIQDNKGRTPLHYAAITSLDVARAVGELITLLLTATTVGFFLGENTLVDLRAVLSVPDEEGFTPLRCCANDSGMTILHRLLDYRGSSWNHIYLFTVLHMLQCDPRVAVLQDHNANTLLHFAAMYDKEQTDWMGGLMMICRLMIAENRDILTIRNNKGMTPLHCAALMNQRGEAIVRLMVEKDSGLLSSRDLQGRTPLHCAALNNNQYHEPFSHEALLDQSNVDLNARDNQGQTPLHYAISNPNVQVLRKFLKHGGVDARTRDSQGRTVSYLAVQNGGARNAVTLLRLRYGVQINARDQHGQTPLHHSVSKCHAEHTMCLLKNGANANLTDCQGRLALHLVGSAEWGGHSAEKALTRLISASHIESFSLRDAQGNLPFFQSATNSHMNEVFWLLQSTAKSGLFENVSSGRANISTTRNVRRRLL